MSAISVQPQMQQQIDHPNVVNDDEFEQPQSQPGQDAHIQPHTQATMQYPTHYNQQQVQPYPVHNQDQIMYHQHMMMYLQHMNQAQNMYPQYTYPPSAVAPAPATQVTQQSTSNNVNTIVVNADNQSVEQKVNTRSWSCCSCQPNICGIITIVWIVIGWIAGSALLSVGGSSMCSPKNWNTCHDKRVAEYVTGSILLTVGIVCTFLICCPCMHKIRIQS